MAADSLPLDVRDYECDLQGIVNNAVYLQYLEHARHRYIKARGLDFAELTRQGIQLVVVRAEVDYKSPLRSGESFVVRSQLERTSEVKFEFLQEIRRVPGDALVLKARVTCAAMNGQGRPMRLDAVERLFEAR
jgi:acyl-CoA thioester hydrolase